MLGQNKKLLKRGIPSSKNGGSLFFIDDFPLNTMTTITLNSQSPGSVDPLDLDKG